MLSPATPIPALLRGKVRALVKAHPEFRIFLEAREILSANAKNRDLIEFALFHPELTSQIETMLGISSQGSAASPSGLSPAPVSDTSTPRKRAVRASKAIPGTIQEEKRRRMRLRKLLAIVEAWQISGVTA